MPVSGLERAGKILDNALNTAEYQECVSPIWVRFWSSELFEIPLLEFPGFLFLASNKKIFRSKIKVRLG